MTPIEKLVAHFGGQTKTAAALGVSQAAVSYWVAGIHSMGADAAFKAEELTNGYVTARQLCARVSDTSSSTRIRQRLSRCGNSHADVEITPRNNSRGMTCKTS